MRVPLLKLVYYSNKFLKVGDIPVIIPKIEATKPPRINPFSIKSN